MVLNTFMIHSLGLLLDVGRRHLETMCFLLLAERSGSVYSRLSWDRAGDRDADGIRDLRSISLGEEWGQSADRLADDRSAGERGSEWARRGPCSGAVTPPSGASQRPASHPPVLGRRPQVTPAAGLQLGGSCLQRLGQEGGSWACTPAQVASWEMSHDDR